MNEIKNDKLKVVINPKGAELWSIQDKEGKEYLWQGDKSIWGSRSPNLFPYIARLTDGMYTLNGQKYNMERHGFVRGSILVPEDVKGDSVTLVLEQNEETKKQYPYDFKYKVVYQLEENRLNITFVVENNSNETMYFAVGGHPGFNVPFDDNLKFEDYYLEFAEEHTPKLVGFTDDCFVNGEKLDYPLIDNKKINLEHSLFEIDAIIFEKTSKSVTIKSDKSEKSITVDFPNFDYMGFWHMPKTEAPYVCVEPWTSLPSRKGIVEDFAEQENLIKLEPNKVYENKWTITIK